MASTHVATKEEVEACLRDRRNWGRWGDRGSAGAMNLIDGEKRKAAGGPGPERSDRIAVQALDGDSLRRKPPAGGPVHEGA